LKQWRKGSFYSTQKVFGGKNQAEKSRVLLKRKGLHGNSVPLVSERSTVGFICRWEAITEGKRVEICRHNPLVVANGVKFLLSL